MHEEHDASGQTPAKLQDILILQDIGLSKRLSQVPSAREIPDQVFEAMSAVLGFLAEEDSTYIQHPDTNRG